MSTAVTSAIVQKYFLLCLQDHWFPIESLTTPGKMSLPTSLLNYLRAMVTMLSLYQWISTPNSLKWHQQPMKWTHLVWPDYIETMYGKSMAYQNESSLTEDHSLSLNSPESLIVCWIPQDICIIKLHVDTTGQACHE